MADHRFTIKPTPLTAATGVNGMMMCDCGAVYFKVGVAVNLENGNNFIRIIECVTCARQQTVVHETDAGLAPSVKG